LLIGLLVNFGAHKMRSISSFRLISPNDFPSSRQNLLIGKKTFGSKKAKLLKLSAFEP
jgi:hypothetical protein